MKKIFILALALVSTFADAQHHQIPEIARGPEIPSKGYLLEEIKDGIYWVADGAYNTMFLVYDNGVVAVDAPQPIGANYLKAIKEVTDKPITHLIYSHSHTDHIGGAHLFPDGIEIIAHEKTKEVLELRNDNRRPIPTLTFSESYELKLGSQVLQLDYYGKNHTDGNIFIYAPKQKVLMLVDVIFPGWIPFKNLGIAEDVPGHMKAHDIALSYDFDVFIAGHVTRKGKRSDIELSRAFEQDLKTESEKAFGKVNFGEIAAEIGTEDKWKLYNAYFEKVVDVAYVEMLKKWKGKMGGLETYLRDDVWAMCEALVVDF